MTFSSYLVGTYERRFGVGTTLQIINPTPIELQVVVAFFDADERFQRCLRNQLTPNDLWEIVVPKLEPDYGVVKAVSHVENRATEGIVGFQRHLLIAPAAREVAFSESPLAAVPSSYAQREYDERIRPHCP